MPRSRFPAGLVASIVLSVAATDLSAVICTVLNSPRRFVGDTSIPGNQCTDNDIQSAIDAIKNGTNTCPATIYITHDHTYTSQHLVFDDTNRIITLVGLGDGVACGSTNLQVCDPDLGCPPAPTVPLNTIDGSSSAGSVIRLDGANTVKLTYLTIQGGAAAYNENGGGIYFSGSGSLTLDTTTVFGNYAGYGAGIYFEGTGPSVATVTLVANAKVTANTAQFSGGGIRMQGLSALAADADGIWIANNKALGRDPISDTDAEGYGGGIEVVGPAHADMGSPGYNGSGVLHGNKAIYGGAMAVFPGSDAYGTANLYTTDPLRPLTLDGNFAAARGGAIYARGSIGSQARTNATVCASNFRIVHNAAADGAAVYLDRIDSIQYGSAGSDLYLNDEASSVCSPLGVACAAGVACNEMLDNESTNANGDPTDGPAIVVASASSIAGDKLDLRGSNGAHAIVLVAPEDTPGHPDLLHNCLIADNVVGQELIVDDTHTLTIDSCTIAGNAIGGSSVTTYAENLDDSLIVQPGVSLGTVANFSYDLIYGSAAFGTVKPVVDPKFVDAGHGDYHLQLGSPAVDYAGGSGGSDLHGDPRDIDLPTQANTYGPRDAGAYERQSPYACDDSTDAVFCTTFDL